MYVSGFLERFALLLIAMGVASHSALAVDITGAGATFPYPIYAKWADAYKQKTGVGLNYQSIGSGGGIKQIVSKTIDFGASDAPLKLEQLDKDGLVQFPMVMGGVVPVVNIEGVAPGQMKLTAKLLADIYLAKVSTEWKDKVGNAPSVSWPAPSSSGGKGNEGVASFVQRIKGAVGYVEYAYAKQNKMTYTLLQNKDGNAMALELDYIPMPNDVVVLVQSAWKSQIKDSTGKTIW